MVLCLLGIGVWLFPLDVSAQDASAPVAEKRGETVIRQAPPAIYIGNAAGGHFLMPGFSFSELDELYKRINTVSPQDTVPSFIPRSVSATGIVKGNYVEMEAQFDIQTFGFLPVRIPLGFNEGIRPGKEQTEQPSFRYTGAGSAEMTVDEEGQHVAIVFPQTQQNSESDHSVPSVQPDASQRHTLSLLLWIPLAKNGGGENRLSLSFPKFSSTQLFLEIPMSNIDVAVNRGILLSKQEHADRQATLLEIQGLRPDTEIAWGRTKIEMADDRPVLQVEQAIIEVRLDAQSATYDAVLPVSSVTGNFEQLQIRLPEGCILDREFTDRHAAANDYSVGEADDDSIVTIRFARRQVNSVSLRLRGRQQFDGDRPDFNRDLAGFEVLGAERQSGTLFVSIFPPEMRPHWEPVRGIRRPEGGSSGTGLSMASAFTGGTRFEFISQPFLLRVQTRPRQTRINVKPEYQFHIRKGRITMKARLAYTVSGSKAEAVYVLLPDAQWLCEFGASSLVDVGGIEQDEWGLLTIPLRSPTEGLFEIEFQARRNIESEEGQIHRLILPMPKPQVDWSESAPVVIISDKNVEALPLYESPEAPSGQRTVGLTRQSRRSATSMPLELTDLQQEPIYYRAEPAHAVFVADLIYHQQKVTAAMQTDVHLFDDYHQVIQTISYEAAYAPVDQVSFLVPRSLELNGDIQVRLENRSLELRDTILSTPDTVPDNWVRKLVQLPEPMFRFQLTFQYFPPPLTLTAEDTAPFALSFVCPSGVPTTNHSIHFYTPPGYKVELQNESRPLWESFRELRRLSSNATETFRSVQAPSRIALFISASDKEGLGTTVVERAWLQTWLAGTLRVDRAMYLLKSARDFVMIQLPPEAMRERQITVRINNRQIPQPTISQLGMLTIPIAPEQQNRPIEISIDYRYAFEMSGIAVPVTLPSFSKETLVQHQFWQVILKQDKHIIGCPDGWTLEYDWNWNGLFWWRSPSVRKEDVGFRSGEESIEPSISETSQYVFSHFQPPSSATLYIVDRSLIVLCASGVALLIGLMLIYVPQSRYAGSLLGLAIALVAVLYYQPPLVLLMLQASVFGVFLALGTGYVYRIFHRQKHWVPPAFSIGGDMPHPYLSPSHMSQTVHEVVMDEVSAGKNADSVVNNGQS